MKFIIDYENFRILDENGTPIDNLGYLHSAYEQACTAEWLYNEQETFLENYPKGTKFSKERAWEIAGIIRDIIDDTDDTENYIARDVFYDLLRDYEYRGIDGFYVPDDNDEE